MPLTGCCCCECVRTSEIGVVERCGAYKSLREPGLTCICWPLDAVVARLSTRIQQLDVPVETKTKDNVFVNVVIAVQYQIIPTEAYSAHYKLSRPDAQITSYVFDVVRATIPKMNLDETFEAKDNVAKAVQEQLEEVMHQYGYAIKQALVVDLSPDFKVQAAMNEINAQQRLRFAMSEKAEGEKILSVKAAEADAESKYLSGVGVARQRKAIVDGLKTSIVEFSGGVAGATPKDVMDLLLLTQYFDMLREVGSVDTNKTLFLPHGPASVTDLQTTLQGSMMKNLAMER